jgi:alpha-amylase/alpha-mannosidase (GH57 family)
VQAHPPPQAITTPRHAESPDIPDQNQQPWTDTPDASVDTTRPYLVRFKSGAKIAVFFYNGPVSRAIAFEGLLELRRSFAARLKSGFKDNAQPQLVHVATDGESYGHHHKLRRNGPGLHPPPA